MKMRVPAGLKNAHSLAVEGETYKLDKEGCVELPNSLKPEQVAHLVDQGWRAADGAAGKKVEESKGK